MKDCCDMKGFLSFIVLHLISLNDMSGEDIRKELEKRRGSKPSPGTIYPVLKELKASGWISETASAGKLKKYRITLAGKKEAKAATKRFAALFHDITP